jgi:hypothetical protein
VRLFNLTDMLRVSGFEPRVEVAQDEVEVSNSVWLELVDCFRQTYVFECGAHHVGSRACLISSRRQMYIDEAKCFLVHCKLQHESAFVAENVHDPLSEVVGLH